MSLPGLRLINHSLAVSFIKTAGGELDRVVYTLVAAKERGQAALSEPGACLTYLESARAARAPE